MTKLNLKEKSNDLNDCLTDLQFPAVSEPREEQPALKYIYVIKTLNGKI